MFCPICHHRMACTDSRASGDFRGREYRCPDHGSFVSGERILNDQVRGHRWLRKIAQARRKKRAAKGEPVGVG